MAAHLLRQPHPACRPSSQALPDDAPVLILFPGLTGGSGDSYVQHAVQQARGVGLRAAVFNSRGTAGRQVWAQTTPNNQPLPSSRMLTDLIVRALPVQPGDDAAVLLRLIH